MQGGEKGRYSFRILGVLKFPMKRTAARPKIGRPLQKQLPSKPIDFVAASPSCVFQDGEGIFLFTLPATFWNLFWTNDRVAQDCNYRVIAVIASCIREWRFAVVGL